MPVPITQTAFAFDYAANAAVKRYPQGYHMLLRDLEGEAVDRDVADWIFRNRS